MIRILVIVAAFALLPARAFASCSTCIDRCCANSASGAGACSCSDPSIGAGCIAACHDICDECRFGKATKIAIAGIDPVLDLSPNRRSLDVGGPFQCDDDEGEFTVQVTVTQRNTGAVGSGLTHGSCTGAEQEFSLGVHANGEVNFLAGPAQACGLAVVTTHGAPTDAFQWCRDVDLQ